ncbi:glycosyltransferase family 2 protein [Tahibacter amnicola]|uniref:Glycosyltransferase family 2 protein n=1 Tax=Tahibacter amnicola TaxID=2976241 RepID=A0ABY6B9I4_9GAMM|nr:glycosyltransferase family 2 protein [Tahibacter amnicola]UXI66339.1 glycosyltransferase family 2 protein [Tahibacter amnicola]
MTPLAQWLFWLSLAGVFYTFIGYPLLVGVLARWRPRPIESSQWQPTVTVCIAMHNGYRWLDAKLDNLLAHDYPPDRLNIVVVSDGSDDGSAERLRARASDRVTVIVEPQRRGKTACLRLAIGQATGEVLVFTDIRQRLEPGSVRALCAALGSGELAAVSGALAFESADGYAASVDAYWRYESWLRRAEAASGSVVGVTGALYAVRRADMPLPPPNLVLDDVWVPMQIAARGGRVGIEPRAIAWDQPSSNAAAESARKRRTLAGNWQLLAMWPRLLLPGAHPLWWRYVSHKVSRLLVPVLLGVAFICNVALSLTGFGYFALFLAQVSAYGVALAGMFRPQWRRWLPVKLAAAFLEMNLYAWAGWLDFLRQRDAHLWKSTPVPDSAGSPP